MQKYGDAGLEHNELESWRKKSRTCKELGANYSKFIFFMSLDRNPVENTEK